MGTCILFTLLISNLSCGMHARIIGKTLKVSNNSVSDMKVLLSGDIETNPGPIENVVSNSISFFPQNIMLLATRL